MCLFPNFLKIKVNILKAYVGAEGLRLLLMTSAIFPVSGFLVSLLLLGNDRQKPDMSLFTVFSQPYILFTRHFPLSSGLQHSTRGTPGIYSLHNSTSCQIPLDSGSAVSPGTQGHFSHCPLSLCVLSVSHCSGADPSLAAVPSNNHLYLHPTCSAASSCGCRLCLREQKVSQGRGWVSGKALGLREGFFGALCLQRAPCCSQPLWPPLPPGQRMHSPSCLRHVKV